MFFGVVFFFFFFCLQNDRVVQICFLGYRQLFPRSKLPETAPPSCSGCWRWANMKGVVPFGFYSKRSLYSCRIVATGGQRRRTLTTRQASCLFMLLRVMSEMQQVEAWYVFFFFFWCFKTHSNNEILPSCAMQKRLKWRAVFLHSCGTLCHVDCLPACLTAWLPAWLTACLTAYHSSVYFSKSM